MRHARGVFAGRAVSLTPKASEVLLADFEVPLVSFENLYGGKLAAAIDRQHPGDLFDVMQLFGHEVITPGIRQAFVVYLASHNRPLQEVLFHTRRNVAQEYDGTFRGMTAEPVSLKDLLKAREQMMTELQRGLNAAERKFSSRWPETDRIGTNSIFLTWPSLTAIRWKVQKLSQLAKANPRKV